MTRLALQWSPHMQCSCFASDSSLKIVWAAPNTLQCCQIANRPAINMSFESVGVPLRCFLCLQPYSLLFASVKRTLIRMYVPPVQRPMHPATDSTPCVCRMVLIVDSLHHTRMPYSNSYYLYYTEDNGPASGIELLTFVSW